MEKPNDLARKIVAHAPSAGQHSTVIPGLLLFRRTKPTSCYRAYEPSLVVFAQGKKRINLGATEYICGPASFVLASIDVPVESQILEASEEVPMLSLMLRLEMPMVREILRKTYRNPKLLLSAAASLLVKQTRHCSARARG